MEVWGFHLGLEGACCNGTAHEQNESQTGVKHYLPATLLTGGNIINEVIRAG